MNTAGDCTAQGLAQAQSLHLQGRAQREAWRHWNAWHLMRLGRPLSLPVEPRRVLQFIEDHARWHLRPDSAEAQRSLQVLQAAQLARGGVVYAGSTLRRRLLALAQWHRDLGLPDPLDTVRIQLALALMRKGAWPHPPRPRLGPAMLPVVARGAGQAAPDSPAVLRDQALRSLVALGPPLGGRLLAQLRARDLEPGSPLRELLETCPAGALQAALEAVRRWQAVRGPAGERLFCHVGADGRLGPPLSAAEIRHLLRPAGAPSA